MGRTPRMPRSYCQHRPSGTRALAEWQGLLPIGARRRSTEMSGRPSLPARAPRKKDAPTALDGLLVVDFTRVVAGPACTQTLADFGAQVIKIENPDGGDDTRHYEHAEIGGESAAYLSLNRNKRGIALDLTRSRLGQIARE